MIGYLTLGTNDLTRAAGFYDEIAGAFGYIRMMQEAKFIAWCTPGGGGIGFEVHLPHDGQPATVGNGVMVALKAIDQTQVNRVHAMALAAGGADEGAPGDRGGGFYAGYFRDLDGNKLNVFTWLHGEDAAA